MSERGGALLAVLWLSAALSAIAFSVATTVRGETERTFTSAESVRAHYMAAGAVDRAILYMLWGAHYRNPDGSSRYYEPGVPRLEFGFPSGVASVELIPESSKLNINLIPPDELLRLLLHLGTEPARAQEIAAAVIDWRAPSPGPFSPFDQFYAASVPSFRARHASIEEIEELLLVKGMTPELFYGGYIRDAQGRLVPTPGLRECVTSYGMSAMVDINTAQPAVLATIGLSPDAIAAIVNRRHALPFRSPQELTAFSQGAGPGFQRLRIGGNTIYSIRATARLRMPDGKLSDLQRTVTAMVKFHRSGTNPPVDILRWYEN